MNSRKPIDIAPSTASAVAVRSTGRRRLNTDTAALQPVSINIHNSIEPSCAPQTAVSRYISGRLASLLAATYATDRTEEHTSELQSLMRISYAVFCLKKHKHK